MAAGTAICDHTSGGHIPHTAVPYSQQPFSTNLKTRLLKFQFPKAIRLKLLCFLFVLVISLFMFVAICEQSCTTHCSGLCNVRNLKPSFLSPGNNSNIHFSHTSRQLPKCIIIGARKAGTRALLRYLNIHPDIVVSNKEPHFFNIDEHYRQGLEYYRKQMPFSFKHQITIEKTPAYFTELPVPERVYRMNKSIQLLLIVRDPVIRLISDYVQLREVKITKNKTIIPFEKEVLDIDGDVNHRYKAVKTSMYCNYLQNWLEFFPSSQLKIVDGDRLIRDPFPVLYDIETYLGIEHRINKDYFVFNKTKGFYCIKDGSLSSCLSDTKGRQHPDIDPSVINKLYKFYAPYNQIFYKMVGVNFNWSTSG